MYDLRVVIATLLLIVIVVYKFSTVFEHFDAHQYLGDVVTSRYSTERVIKQGSPNQNPDRETVLNMEHISDGINKKRSAILKRDYNSYDSAWGSESSELSELFFSESNIDYLLDALRKEVYNYTERVNGTPIDIGTQPRKDFICIMMSALAIHRQHIDSYQPIETQLKILNSEFIDRITPKVAGQTVSHLKFLNDISTPYTLVDIPESTRLDSKEIRLFSF